MATTYKDYNELLELFYMHKTFLDMPNSQFLTYVDALKANDGKGDFIGNMKKWRDNKFVVDTTGNGNWEKNDILPGQIADPTTTPPTIASDFQLEDEAWEDLYKMLRNAFRTAQIAIDKAGPNSKKFEKDFKNFVKDYYSMGDIFSDYTLPQDTKQQIKDKLLPLLQTHKSVFASLKNDTGIKNFDEFLDNIVNENFTPEVRDQLSKLIGTLNYQISWGTITPELANALSNVDLEQISRGLDETTEQINPDQLAHFKTRFSSLLKDASKSKVIKNFQTFAPDISNAINSAKEKVDYKNENSDDYLSPKRDDEMTPWQKFSDKVGKNWHDHMDKYTKFYGGHVFFSPQAKAIADGLDATKFRPNDGLDKLLEKSGEIKGKIKSASAKKQFDWMTKKLGELKKKKMFKGALKNAKQMKKLVAELTIMALEDGKDESIEALKTTMEVLSVIRYGYTTSNVLDAMKKENLSIFSDKNLSWNKNEGIAIVTAALDKSIKYAGLATGYVLNGAAHFVNSRDKKAGKNAANKYQVDARTRNDEEKQRRIDEFERQKSQNDRNIAARQGTLAGLDSGAFNINDTTVAAREATVASKRNYAEHLRTNKQQLTDDFNNLNTEVQGMEQTINAQKDRGVQYKSVYDKIKALTAQIDALDSKTDLKESEKAKLIQMVQQREALEQQKEQIKAEIQANTYVYAQTNRNIDQKRSDLSDAQTAKTRAENKYNNNYQNAIDDANQLQDKINEFRTAKDDIARMEAEKIEFDARIANLNTDYQDKFEQLMAHWDFLQSGKDRHGEGLLRQAWNSTVFSGQKSKQAKYDQKDMYENPFTGTTEKMSKKEWLRLQWMKKNGYQAA